MRSLLVGMALVAVTAPAWAQVPAGPIPATATAQRTEPGRYWCSSPITGRACSRTRNRSWPRRRSRSCAPARPASRWSAAPTARAPPPTTRNCRSAGRRRCGPSWSGWACRPRRSRSGPRARMRRSCPRRAAWPRRATATSPSTSPSARRRRRWPPPPRSRRRHPRRRRPRRRASAPSSAASPATISRKTTAATPTPTICSGCSSPWATSPPPTSS